MRSLMALLLILATGCTTDTRPVGAQTGGLGSSQIRVLARFEDGFAIHGVAGDQRLLFAAQPGPNPTVHVASRLTGRDIGDLPPPHEGWGVPLSMKVVSYRTAGVRTRGELLILDNRVPPALAGAEAAKLYRYTYRSTSARSFTAAHVATYTLPLNTRLPGSAELPDGLFYPGSFTLLPGGGAVVTDSLTGALWVSDDLES